jgi:uncharacterized protein YcfJ
MKIALAALIALTPISVSAAEVWENGIEHQPGYAKTRTCYKSVYKEEYVPGTEFDPGYVKSSKETIEVPCKDVASDSRIIRRTVVEYDTNDCSDGTIAGALLGGGLAGFGSRGKDRWWAIPSGIIGGAMVGCQLDGG